ncbi:glycosyltransferase [Undibacterium sp. RuRC25W]|uniref:glycosyltransferase n=1 Tax=Undibacterium sp. RuRC25W TaxID=3413047 RepID=UPI003BF1C4F1
MFNIVHFGKYYFPDSGGIESVTASLAKGAVEAGHDVTVVCFSKKEMLKRNEILDGVHVVRNGCFIDASSQPVGFKYILNCINISQRADIVHLHTPNMLAALCGVFLPKKVKLLVHWHSDVVGKGLLGWLLAPLERILLKRADCIVVTSPVYANSSIVLRPFSSKIKVIPIGVPDALRMDANVDVGNDLINKLNGKRVVLSVGRLVPYKGFDILIEAAKIFPEDVMVVIVGGGAQERELKKKIYSANLENSVLLAGRVEDQTLSRLFQVADLFCLPSIERSEAFGVVLLEAMSYGLPIVATNIVGSGVPWVNLHNTSGLNVTVGDAKELASACMQILSDTDTSTKFSVGARNRYLKEFTESLSVKRVLTIYEELSGS